MKSWERKIKHKIELERWTTDMFKICLASASIGLWGEDIFKDNKAMTRKEIIDAFKQLLDFYALTGKPFKLIDRDPYHL